MKWQPIDTAPKDRVIVLGLMSGVPMLVVWRGETWALICATAAVGGAVCNGDEFVPVNPTHWMPLPQPPEDKT